MPASRVPPLGTRGKFNSIKRSENSLSGSVLVFETSIRIVSLSSCLPYPQETRPQGYLRLMVSPCLFGVAPCDEEPGKNASNAARKNDFCGCNSPFSGETRSDCPLNESESRPRAPTEKSKPLFTTAVRTTGIPCV